MSSATAEHLSNLRERIRALGSVLVAYSGGVDSTLVAAVAHEQLGSRALACIGTSPSYPARELQEAVRVAEQVGFACHVLETEEHIDPRYAENSPGRCFFCKSHLFTRLRALAHNEGWQTIADGVHADDLADHTGGISAARKHEVRSPLLECGLTKSDVRGLARELNLPVWDKPAAPCLASRVPHGTAITPQLLQKIERAESVLSSLGFRHFRVRHHGDLARIELPPAELSRGLESREQIINGVARAGYRYVTLDLAGFRNPD